MHFEVIGSEPVYSGRAFNVRKDRVRIPTGAIIQLDIVEHVGAITILPIDEQGRVWFVRQYRHASGQELLELPAGTLEKGEDPAEGAGREIREEIGMRAGSLQKIGEFFLAPGYSTEFMHIFLAKDLQPDPLPQDHDEFLSLEQVHLDEIGELVRSGKILDGKTLAALYLLGLS